MFPYLQKKEEAREKFVDDIAQRLDFAFKRVRKLQEKASARNKERRPPQTKPDFRPGDLLLLMERSAKEGRIEERTAEGKAIPLPEKLRLTYTGPYTMLRWCGDLKCVIDMNGKAVAHNVNRLIKHHSWDDQHPMTDTPRPPPTPAPPRTPGKGEIFAFLTAVNEENKCDFGLGRVIELELSGIYFQWLGNHPLTTADKKFRPGWIDPKDGKHYYAEKKNKAGHQLLTNKDTLTTVAIESVIASGPNLLGSNHHISPEYRIILESHRKKDRMGKEKIERKEKG